MLLSSRPVFWETQLRFIRYFSRRTQLLGQFFLFSFYCFAIAGNTHAQEDDFWADLRSGNHVVLMRHALAPGIGDPPDFDLEDCSTQRNLSDAGRRQAEEVGVLFRRNGIDKAHIFSSQWCRCLETARLLALGPVNELALLNSFFRQREKGKTQTWMLQQWLERQDLHQPLILVTHQVNITAFSGIYPASGEIVLLR
ncbi:MAG: histidine phosphatase family protein, partial [Desulfopila sp.]|nr:histidine phosphatase family protein [Desulfopila sp.]